MKKREYQTVESLVELYFKNPKDRGHKENNIMRHLEKYVAGRQGVRARRTYTKAARLIKTRLRNEVGTEQPTEQVVVSQYLIKQSDPYDKLEQGQQLVNEAIVEIAELEANRRAEQKITDLKKKYEDELARMQAVLVEAKESSVVGVLRKHFNHI